MGISRDSRHKRRATGGKRAKFRKKRKFELGRPAAATRISSSAGDVRVRLVRTRGGNRKFRALRLEAGNFAWPTQSVARKARILKVVYNASNNELVRTNTLVKNCIVQIDAAPFRSWYEKASGIDLGKKKKEEKAASSAKPSRHVLAKQKAVAAAKIEPHLVDEFAANRLYACISSRPGQCGRADGYVLEGKELDFYIRKLSKKKN